MSDYKITDYTKKKARDLGVIVKPSTNQKKKLDVYDKKGDKLASIGGAGYKDYPTYLRTDGKVVADKRRELYLIRHKKDKGVAGTLARNLLW